MRDVIQKVIATEAEAKQQVLAARSEAERILSETQKRAQELTAGARSAVQLETNSRHRCAGAEKSSARNHRRTLRG
jgi:vacuolar-type H+-ATPase subunit H